jgi:hypothetical protein
VSVTGCQQDALPLLRSHPSSPRRSLAVGVI